MKKIIIFLIFLIITGSWGFFWWSKMHTIEKIIIIDDGEEKIITNVQQGTICNVLNEIGIEIKNYDKISPKCDKFIEKDLIITIKRKKIISLKRGNNNIDIEIFGKEKLKNILLENDIKYDSDDIISENLDFVIENDTKIEIIVVDKEKITENRDVKFDKIIKKDRTKEIGYKKITQAGVLGVEELTYDIVLHDNEEFSRVLFSQKIVKEAVDQITTIGTKKVYKFGKSHKGQASWYIYKGCDCAANQWLEIGSKVKVTNKENGKSVIVTINDRGPFSDGRILDLDKVAFKKIASIGVGVIDIKMEEIEE